MLKKKNETRHPEDLAAAAVASVSSARYALYFASVASPAGDIVHAGGSMALGPK